MAGYGHADPDLEKWTRDYERLRSQKHRSRGGVENSMLLDYLLYEGEHQSVQVQNMILTRSFRQERDKNRLRLVIPLARRLINRMIGRHYAINHKYQATPNRRDPLDFDRADVITEGLIPGLDFRLQQGNIRWQIFKWMTICGVAFEHCGWEDNVTTDVLPVYSEDGETVLWEDTLSGAQVPESVVQQLLASGQVAAERFQPMMESQTTGEVQADVYDPFRVFVDASVGMVKDLGPDQRIYLADIRSLDWVEENFGSGARNKIEPMEDLSIIKTQLIDRGMPVSGVNLKDLLPLVQGGKSKDDPDMVVVLTMYQPPSKKEPKGIRAFIVPDQCILNKDMNPYPEVPIVDWHWATPGASMWTVGFARDQQGLSKFINKRFSQLGEASNAQLYEMLAVTDDISEADIPTDFPGIIKGGVSDEGALKVQPIRRGELPSFFIDSMRLSTETLESIGGSDLLSMRNQFSQMRGPLAIPMFMEIIDTEDGPRFQHVADQFALEKQMRNNRVKEYYEPIRTLNFLGQDMRMEVLDFHADEVLRAGTDFTVTVDPTSIVPELSSMREARVRERMMWAPGLYVNPRTGTMDWSKVAKDLKYNDTHRMSSENRGRKLARQLVLWARKGKLTTQMGMNPQTQQPIPQLVYDDGRPFIVYPFWNHNAMMDEYQDQMETTEFLEASPAYVRVIMTLYEAHRAILSQIDQARAQSVENKMVQGAMAQASQQAAAKAASVAAEAAIEQVMYQNQSPGGAFANMAREVKALLGAAQGQQNPPQRPQSPTVGPRRLPQGQ